MTPQRFAQRVRNDLRARLMAAWRRTAWPAVATLACVVVLGAAIDHWLPEARSLPHALRLLGV
jgi:hypothetical protein